MINNVVLVGRLTKDPDLRYTPAGAAVATFTLAVNRNFTDKSGNREADFIQCVIWRKSAELMANMARKGTLVGIVGRIQTRNYDNQQGQRVYVTEVVADSFQLLESKSQSEQRSPGSNSNANYSNNNSNNSNNNFNQTSPKNEMPDFSRDVDPFGNDGSTVDISDDDLPF
ncbi:single-stranded DNA-binding protein [Enterococcus timonensis]|uniref:single-stranded DNA-binding protein n=1 Tax=Enterococcus timonensis TaxID=1852364 RepID=UPI0008D9EBBA|nr:single-stranded DNA-binding protein [Enterococcus timonensis]